MTKIRKPAELTLVETTKALIYGQPGIGKTTLALSYPSPLMIDCDRGIHRVDSSVLTDTVEVNNWEDVDEVLKEDLSAYQTIIFDTGGKLIDYMTEFLIRMNPKLTQTDGTFSLKGYGARKQMFSQLLTRLQTMGKHVVFVAHEREERDGETRFVRPEIGGSSGNDLIKELDLVGYIEAVGTKRTIHFNPTEKFYAKNSMGLPQSMEIPNFEKGNKFMTDIVNIYLSGVEARKELNKVYFELLSGIEKTLEGVKTEQDANAAMQEFLKLEHIWDSKLKASKALRDKAKELNLEFNRETGKFVKSKPADDAALNPKNSPSPAEKESNTTVRQASTQTDGAKDAPMEAPKKPNKGGRPRKKTAEKS